MAKISFIYFDVGGVLIKDFSNTDQWRKMYLDAGIKEDQLEKINEVYDKYARKLNTVLDIDAFLPLLKKETEITFPLGYSMLSDMISRFQVNKSIWPIVKAVQAKYRTGLLTNMYPKMLDAIKAAELLPPGKWDILLDSSVEGVQKPDSVIFQIATKWTGEKHENVLFIDNTKANINRAKSVGMQTFHYDSSNYKQASQDLTSFLKL